MDRTTAKHIRELIYLSKRPLLIIGNGARGSFHDLLELPTVTTRLGIDLMDSSDRYFVGRAGLVSDRPSHFAIQSADLVLCIGARLDTGFVGYNPKDWGRNAKIIIVDIDEDELHKEGVEAYMRICMDSKRFVNKLLKGYRVQHRPDWLERIHSWRHKYPLPKTGTYRHISEISMYADADDIVVVDTSSSFHVAAQMWKIKQGQRYITTGGISTMGYWPAAIGAQLASGKRVICITGDGCMQMNVQELATVVKHRLNIKIFLLNNNGYLLIRHTQKNHLGGRLIGEGAQSGLGFPNFRMIARAYGIPYTKSIEQAFNTKGPVMCELKTPYWEKLQPRISGKKQADGTFVGTAYEDLDPYLPREELAKNMTI